MPGRVILTLAPAGTRRPDPAENQLAEGGPLPSSELARIRADALARIRADAGAAAARIVTATGLQAYVAAAAEAQLAVARGVSAVQRRTAETIARLEAARDSSSPSDSLTAVSVLFDGGVTIIHADGTVCGHGDIIRGDGPAVTCAAGQPVLEVHTPSRTVIPARSILMAGGAQAILDISAGTNPPLAGHDDGVPSGRAGEPGVYQPGVEAVIWQRAQERIGAGRRWLTSLPPDSQVIVASGPGLILEEWRHVTFGVWAAPATAATADLSAEVLTAAQAGKLADARDAAPGKDTR